MSQLHVDEMKFELACRRRCSPSEINLLDYNIVEDQILSIPSTYSLVSQANYNFEEPPSILHGAPSVVYCDSCIYVAVCDSDPHHCLCHFWLRPSTADVITLPDGPFCGYPKEEWQPEDEMLWR